MSYALALGIDSASMWRQTEVYTRTILATLGFGAVKIPHLLHPSTFHLWVSSQTEREKTDWAMVGHPAVGSGGAPSIGTGVLTMSRHTDIFADAVIVIFAAIRWY